MAPVDGPTPNSQRHSGMGRTHTWGFLMHYAVSLAQSAHILSLSYFLYDPMDLVKNSGFSLILKHAF